MTLWSDSKIYLFRIDFIKSFADIQYSSFDVHKC